jgi:hypothetical protein
VSIVSNAHPQNNQLEGHHIGHCSTAAVALR